MVFDTVFFCLSVIVVFATDTFGELGGAPRLLLDGDIVIGGLFDLHDNIFIADDSLARGPIEETCVGFSMDGFLQSQAMVFAIDEINNRRDILPNVTLGYDLRDICTSTSQSLLMTYQLVVSNDVSVSAVIGASGSDTTMAVAEFLNVYNIPVISYDATSSLLNDRQRYKSFFRTVPSDVHQAMAMVDLITHFGWDWVGIIGADNFYGRPATGELKRQLEARGACVAFYEILPVDASDEAVALVVDKMAQNPSTTVIATFLYTNDAEKIIQHTARRNLTDRIFLASEAWALSKSAITTELEKQTAEGTLGIIFPDQEIPGFSDYVSQLNPFHTVVENPWLDFAWETLFNCTLPTGRVVPVVTDTINTEAMATVAMNSYGTDSEINTVSLAVTDDDIDETLNTDWITKLPALTSNEIKHTDTTEVSRIFPTMNDQTSHQSPSAYSDISSAEAFSASTYFQSTTTDQTPGPDDSENYCTGTESLSASPAMDAVDSSPYIYRVYLAVYAVAHALHDMLRCTTPHGLLSEGSCPNMDNLQSWQLLKYIRHVNFSDNSGRMIHFDDEGSVEGLYDIVNWQIGKDGFGTAEYKSDEESENNSDKGGDSCHGDTCDTLNVVTVGQHDGGYHITQRLNVDNELLVWKNSQMDVVPMSRCNTPCQPGERRGIVVGFPICCYECVHCPEGSISNETDSTECTACPQGTWSNEDHTECTEKYLEYLAWNDPAAIVCVVIIIIGLLANIAVMVIFIYYRETPVVKASNRELSFLMLAGLFVCFCGSFTVIGRPTRMQCLAQVPLRSIAFTMCISILLVKTHRIMTVFGSKIPNAHRHRCLAKTKLQLLAVGALTFGQVLICITWLGLLPPLPIYNTDSAKRIIYVECDTNFSIPMVVMFCYTWIIAGVCLVFAFRTRKLPENFNEAKYITFSMLIYFLLWLIYFPTYFGTNGRFKALCQVILLITSSYALFVCIFFPKCHVIIFTPHLNSVDHIRRSTLHHADRRTSALMDFRRRLGSHYGDSESQDEARRGDSESHISDGVVKRPISAVPSLSRSICKLPLVEEDESAVPEQPNDRDDECCVHGNKVSTSEDTNECVSEKLKETGKITDVLSQVNKGFESDEDCGKQTTDVIEKDCQLDSGNEDELSSSADCDIDVGQVTFTDNDSVTT
ncbi:extracellular calcium-sensing receptor-like [Ptychodera flava]|uniref:extracellular calcium-sensing receptor-like n=1 Tax=Ptychodera flava TaxID=63121 RepID=UPI00396A77D2